MGGEWRWNRRETGAVWKIGRLAPGKTEDRDLQTFRGWSGKHENVVQATADGGLRETASCKVLVQEPKLSVKIARPRRKASQSAREVSNHGDERRPGAPHQRGGAGRNTDRSAVAGPPSHDGRQSGNQIRWLLGEAPPGKAATLTVELTAARETEAALRVTARADRGVTDQAEAKQRLRARPGCGVDASTRATTPSRPGMSWRTPSVFRTAGRPLRGTCDGDDPGADAAGEAERDERADAERPNAATFPSLPTLAAGAEETYTIRLRAVRAGEVKLALDLASAELTAPLRRGGDDDHLSAAAYITRLAGAASRSPAAARPGIFVTFRCVRDLDASNNRLLDPALAAKSVLFHSLLDPSQYLAVRRVSAW